MPKAIGYRSHLTLEFVEESGLYLTDVATKDNPIALVGASAYAMWPIIENQTDVMPNNGDLAQMLSGLGV